MQTRLTILADTLVLSLQNCQHVTGFVVQTVTCSVSCSMFEIHIFLVYGRGTTQYARCNTMK